jgi:hypothetical protein
MPSITLPDAQIAQLGNWVADYISDQRTAFNKKAQPVSNGDKKKLRLFFPAEVLENVRIVRGRASEPSFYTQLKAMGIRNAPAFSSMAGITFQDVIVHVDPLTDPLLFHELVHAVQYKHLGLHGFAQRYVRGFLMGGSYEAIPLEQQAYKLEDQFVTAPSTAFSVEESVLDAIRGNRL